MDDQAQAQAFTATLDHGLFETEFEEGTVAYNVEECLQAIIKKHDDAAEGIYDAFVFHKIVLSTIRRVIETEREFLSGTVTAVSKMDFGYKAKLAARETEDGSESPASSVVACLTCPLNGIKGSTVPLAVVEEVLTAASKVYLRLAHAIGLKEAEMSQRSRKTYSRPLVLRPFGKTSSAEVDAAKHGSSAGPRFLESVATSKGVIGLGPDTQREPSTPQKKGGKGKGEAAPVFGQQQITSLFKPDLNTASTSPTGGANATDHLTDPVDGEDTQHGTSGFTQINLPTSTPTLIPSSPATPSSSTTTGQGNHGHGRSVPWLQDEVDFIQDLILNSNDNKTWKQLTDESNAHFKDKPIIKSNGTIIARGSRNMQSVRQRLSVFRAEMRTRQDAEATASATAESVRAEEQEEAQDDHDAAADADEMMRRHEEGELALEDENEEAGLETEAMGASAAVEAASSAPEVSNDEGADSDSVEQAEEPDVPVGSDGEADNAVGPSDRRNE